MKNPQQFSTWVSQESAGQLLQANGIITREEKNDKYVDALSEKRKADSLEIGFEVKRS